MTAIVGVLCKDGVVLGTDSSTTFVHGAYRTIEQPTEKLEVIGNSVVVAGTGAVGLNQRFCDITRRGWDRGVFQKDPLEIAKILSKTMIEDMRKTYLTPGQYGALVAFPVNDKPCLCEFAPPDFQPELKTEHLWYCSMGSSQPITDPFLALMREVFWDEGPPAVQDATFAVIWALAHAVKVNPGGVNEPIRVALLEHVEDGKLVARLLDEAVLGEHRQNIEEAKARLRSFRDTQKPDTAVATPQIPRPPAKKTSSEVSVPAK